MHTDSSANEASARKNPASTVTEDQNAPTVCSEIKAQMKEIDAAYIVTNYEENL